MAARNRIDWLWAAAIIALTLGVALWDSVSATHNRRAEVEVRLDALAKVVEARLGQTLRAVDLLLRDAGEELTQAAAPGDPAFHRYLSARSRFESGPLSVTVVAPDGRILHSSIAGLVGQTVGQRSYLKHYLDNPDSDGLFVSEPVPGLLDRTVIFATRPVRGEDGELKVILLTALSPELFESMINAALPSEPSGLISVTNSDHVLLAASPPLPGVKPGRSLATAPLRLAHLATGRPASIQEGQARLDDFVRIIAYRTVEPWGLVVGVSAARDHLLAPLLPHYLGNASIVVLVSVVVLLFMRSRAHREVARRAAETQMLRARDHYLHVLDDMPALVRRLDGDGNCVNVNAAWCGLTGLTAEQSLGTGWLRVVVAADRDGLAIPGEHEYRLLRADGGTSWIHELTRPLKDQDGNDMGILAVGIDVTQSREFQEKLQQSNAELEQFAYVASHDLREPLRMVNSYMGLVERRLGGDLPEEIREFLAFARDGAQRMDKLILDLLQYSRIGRMSAPRTMVALDQALEEAKDSLSLALAEQGATITAAGLPAVYASADDMVRLFQHLLANALKYRQPNLAPHVTIAAQRVTGAWQISVSDNGIGISREFFDRIFRIFQRLHGRDEHGGGSGIGLPICKKIVEGHGGRIWVDSPGPNQGSVFTFTLPA